MTERELLLKDLVARFPYGVIVRYKRSHDEIDKYLDYNDLNRFECLKPYLRPLSSMTDEEKKELICVTCGKNAVKYFRVLSDGSIDSVDAREQNLNNFQFHWVNFSVNNVTSYIDYLNKHRFDYHGLIEKGLAIEAPEGMYN